mmetsp:Transcript_58009/g.109282  ORF Transcript_58009/g.109282 Transcript_58009/m.109282 type:complete len:558 (-) Transcript_58009:19-1692(-)
MVEGPQCRMFKDRVARLWGQRLRQIIKAPRDLCDVLQWLIDRRLVRVFNVGKELFFIFEHPRNSEAEGNDVIRVHFGINGFARVTDAGVDLNSHRVPFVVLEFEKLRVHFRAKVKVVPCTYALAVEQRMTRDINSEHFDYKGAISRLRRHRGIVADAIMDQKVIPGVGNVIKCEAMFTAKVHPLRKIKTLGVKKVRLLLDELRWFANWWYQNPMCDPDLRASGNSKIYGYDVCSSCAGRVALIKKGSTSLPRLTYYCPVCQADESVKDKLTDVLLRTPCMDNGYLQITVPKCDCGSATVMYASHRVIAAGPIVEDRVGVQLKQVSQRAATSVQERPICVESADFGRLRFLCQHGFKGGCGYASWADAQLPQCDCSNGRNAALGRVLSINENHGKYFACCGMSYDRTACCRFFSWVQVPLQVAWHQPTSCHNVETPQLEVKDHDSAEPHGLRQVHMPEESLQRPVRRWSAVPTCRSAARRWHRCGSSLLGDVSSMALIENALDEENSALDTKSVADSIASTRAPDIPRRWCRTSASESLQNFGESFFNMQATSLVTAP